MGIFVLLGTTVAAGRRIFHV